MKSKSKRLLKERVITQEEFDLQKEKLLNLLQQQAQQTG